MTKRCNFVSNVSVATLAGVGGVAFLGASRSGYNCIVIVTESVNNFLCNENVATNGAVFTFGKTGFGAGRFNCCINNLGVTESVNLISNVSIATVTSVGGVTFCGAGRIGYNCIVIVTVSGNDFLCYKSFAANRAVQAFCQTSFGAGGFNCLVSNLGVTERCNFVSNVRVAAEAGVGGVTTLKASGLGYFCFVIVAVCRNDFLCYNSFAANGAMRTFCQTGFGAGGFNCFVSNLGVTERCNFVCNVSVAAEASVGGVAACCASRSGYSSFVLVTKSINDFLSNKNFAALGTMLTFGQACFGAGRSNRIINNDDVFVLLGRGLFGSFRRSCILLGSACGLLVCIGVCEERKLLQSITRCHSQQNQSCQGDQNERFEKSFHFSPSRK